MRYLPHTEQEIQEMLQKVGVGSLDELFSTVCDDCKVKGLMDLPEAKTEWELNEHMSAMAAKNATAPEYNVFAGAGSYSHYIPSLIPALVSRSEFLTAYTPYQPEVSQGTLQSIYEFQTMVSGLLGMDVVNASVYDGGMGLAEALLMAIRVHRKKKVAVSKAINPNYRKVVDTYFAQGEFEIVELPFSEDGRTDLSSIEGADDLAAVAIQSPNYFGVIEDMSAAADKIHAVKAAFVASFSEAMAYGLLKSPGACGADICTGEGQSLGIPQSFGGPGLGLFSSTKKYMRQMPGRLVGRTEDRQGNGGYVITLSTREQHIRRERATSNICSNQSLCATMAGMYLATVGKEGMREIAKQNYDKAEYMKAELAKVGCKVKFASPTFNEFVVEMPQGAYDKLLEKKIVAGVPMECHYPELKGCYLICATETKSKAAIDALVKEVA